MKKLFGILFLLVLIAVGAVVFLIATFDAEKYRPVIEEKLTEAVGNPVRLGAIDLSWKGVLALDVQGLQITEDGKTALSVKRATAAVDLFALLRKQISIPSVEIEAPQIALFRDASGETRVVGIRPKPDTASEADEQNVMDDAAKAPAVGLNIRSAKIIDGSVSIVDMSGAQPIRIDLNDLDIEVKDIALGSPMRIEGAVSVFSNKQNLRLDGEVTARHDGGVLARDMEVRTDLADLNWPLLSRSVPQVGQLPFAKPPLGKIKATLSELNSVPGQSLTYKAELDINDAALAIRDLRPEITGIRVDASMNQDDIDLEFIKANLAGGSVEAAGDIKDWAGAFRTTLESEAQGLLLENILPLDASGKTILEGRVGAAFKGNFAGNAWPVIRENLTGDLVADLPNGLMLNMNIVKETIGKLESLFPGIVANVESQLPESYRAKLTEQSTVLKPFRHRFPIQNGVMMVRDLGVETDFFSAGANGDFLLRGEFNGKGRIQLDQTFSNALFQSAPTLQLLANAVSKIELPLLIHYQEKRLSILPDLQEIGRRLIPQSGGQLLQQMANIGKAAGTTAAGSAQGASETTSQAASSGGGLFGQLQGLAAEALKKELNG